VDDVINLSKRHQSTLGQLPFEAFHVAADARQLLVARHKDELAGYVLFRVRRRPPAVMLTQLCTSEEFTRRGVARALVDAIVAEHPNTPGLGARCRNDYPAHAAWPSLGFYPRGERPGQSRQGLPLTDWWRPVNERTLLTFDRDTASLPAAALDADVARDLLEPRPQFVESLSLDVSWLADHVEFVATGQLELEIRSTDCPPHVASALSRYRRLAPSAEQWERCAAEVIAALDGWTPGQGDIRQIAQATAGGATYFLTRDEALLQRGVKIENAVGLRVMRPADFVLAMHSATHEGQYRAEALMETAFTLRKCDELPSALMLQPLTDHASSERTTDLEFVLRDVAAHTDSGGLVFVVEDPSGALISIAAATQRGPDLEVLLLRSRPGSAQHTFVRQMSHYLRAYAVKLGLSSVVVRDLGPRYLADALSAEGFDRGSADWRARCLPGVFASLDAASIDDPRVGTRELDATLVNELELRYWPAKFVTGETPTYVVPIKPVWARALFGQEPSQLSLLNRPDHLGVAREHVYYRSLVSTIKAPARLVWFVTGGAPNGGARAVSWLDRVEVGRPRALHRRFGPQGIYTSADVERIVRRPGGKALAMIFGRTEVLRHQITLREAARFHPQIATNLYLRTSRLVDEHVFEQYYKRGMGIE